MPITGEWLMKLSILQNAVQLFKKEAVRLGAAAGTWNPRLLEGKQEDGSFEARLGKLVRSCLKVNKKG